MMSLSETNMQVTIIIDGVERTYQGDYDELHNFDWNIRVRDLLDCVDDVNEIPQMEGTLDALDNISL